MYPLKLIFSVIVLSLGISGAVYVANYRQSSPPITASDSYQKNQGLEFIYKKQPLVEQLTNQSISSSLLNEESLRAPDNLTETFIKHIAKTLVEGNPDGPSIIDNQQLINAPNPDEIIDNLLAETLQNFNAKNLAPIIKDTDLNISDDNSKEALTKYFIAFKDIVVESAKKLPKNLSLDAENLFVKDIQQISVIYQSAIHKFYNLPAPRLTLEIHKKELAFLLAKNYILEKIQNYQSDPVSAIVAIQAMESLDKEFLATNQTIMDFFESVL